MRGFFYSVVIVLFSLTWVNAQQNDPATQANSPSAIPNANSSTPQNDSPNSAYPNSRGDKAKSSNADQNSIQGCLRQSSGAYLLDSDSGTTYRLKGNTDGLTQDVGKEVRIQGAKSSDASGGMASSSGGSTGAATSNRSAGAEPTIQVSSANVIADTCQKSNKQ